ncbi:MAG: LysM peptidoglycan-binding domain-containing protein [Sporolactobacillus sp.]
MNLVNSWLRHTSVALVIVGIILFTFFSLSHTVNADDTQQYRIITIHYGDTLWHIANAMRGESHLSNEQFINWVERTNGISGDQINAGQKLYIPVPIHFK